MRRGQWVRCDRERPGVGTWPKYAGRVGRVVSLHRETFPSGGVYVELGVNFGDAPDPGDVDAWFRPDELQTTAARLAQRPLRAANGHAVARQPTTAGRR